MSEPVKVKICGLTSLADAQAAVEAGADFLGFVFWDRSPRRINFDAASEIIRHLPSKILKVGVFVDAPEEAVQQAIQICGLDLLQFHGDETPAYCLRFGIPSLKAFRIRDAASLSPMASYLTHGWLLDACAPGSMGGTGEKFDWDLAIEARSLGRPIFLAGGLTPGNVAAAVAHVRPYAVDVSSGVEAAPGKKDHAKIWAFIRAAKAK